MESKEKVKEAVSKVFITKEQREAQTAEFLAKIQKQRESGEIPGKPKINDMVRK